MPAKDDDKNRLSYGASNYTPDRGGLGGLSFGRVGDSARSAVEPGRSFGSGVGATMSLPMKRVSKKKGGSVKKMAAGGSASKRADGCATKGKTKGRFV